MNECSMEENKFHLFFYSLDDGMTLSRVAAPSSVCRSDDGFSDGFSVGSAIGKA